MHATEYTLPRRPAAPQARGLGTPVTSLPGATRVIIDDMDHFGPAWSSFPATDRYDPARLWLSCVSLVLRGSGGKGAGRA